ncbi:prolyl oligopeptidase Serine peptidase. MEROPS family S09A [Spirosomataceae bacterium TFI 002]|nr:prolyl oligopeptidase Serine peptidase. MEROPS family S09A [Spirosomataceae bacterium TFI 002]
MKKYIALLFMIPVLSIAQLKYPDTKKVDQVDDYHGTKVPDPYRWLEDDRSEETGAWVIAQNKVTDQYLSQIPFKSKLEQRLEEVYNYPKYSSPSRKGEWFYFSKNDGLQNQSVLYRQKGLNGTPEVVIDPNKLSPDGTTRLTQFRVSKDGKHAAYALSEGGSDWQTIYIMDLDSKKTLADKLEWVKVSGIAWQGDGFYYSRYPKPDGSALAAKNENHQVWFHKLNTSQENDDPIFEDNKNPQRFNTVSTTEDEEYAFLYISDRGSGKDGNALYYRKRGDFNFSPIITEITDFSYSVVENLEDVFIIRTTQDAPNEKLVSFRNGNWSDYVSEKEEPLQSASVAGGKLFVTYLKDVATVVYVHSLDGRLENVVEMPALGTVGGFGGNMDDEFVFYTFTSFTFPPTIYKYDIASGTSTEFRKPEVAFKATDFETDQVFYVSKDGTKVPMFITYKKGLKKNGKNPTLLYGYGGFNITLNPSFNPLLIPFLEQGGVYAQANLRGGGEYGEEWHQQGMKLKKQNVFDDFIAAGEYLKRENFCDSEHLALRGGSNGGLLVGAVINQRPDLAKVAIPQVGVMDMLRFQKFTIGWNWIADYGTSDNADEFAAQYAYSPLHNIKSGVNYPATLVTTADHDDRVVPAHSFKYAATLQEKAAASTKNPLLIRIDTNSGHGASNTKKNIELYADIYGFIFWNMGIKTLK